MLHLLEQLALTSVDEQHFVGQPSNESHIRTFGGQIVAQALLAAGRTVDTNRLCHSLHGYFLRPGNTDQPMDFAVDVVRNGRSFSMRHVNVTQNDRLLFTLMASFHTSENGSEHAASMPDVVHPESLAPFAQRFAGRESNEDMGRWFDRTTSFDIRYVGPSPFDITTSDTTTSDTTTSDTTTSDTTTNKGRSQVWMRFTEPLGDDPLLHQAVAAYVSDLSILDPILLAHNRRWTDGAVIGASLDHTLWFHHDLDATQWLLFDQESAVAAHSRGLARAQVWNESGQLVASIAQEALLRPPHSSSSGQ